jgi:LAS superfamily LD-carboxypeptidase LdcB
MTAQESLALADVISAHRGTGKPMRPDVALAFDRMAAAARREAGLDLSITSAFRSDAEQARLWEAKPTPHLFSAL